MNNLNVYGMRLVENPSMCTTKPLPHTVVEKILMWNPCNPWRGRTETIPNSNVICDRANNIIYGHPVIIAAFKNSIQSLG